MQAYQNAGYLNVTVGIELNNDTGEITTGYRGEEGTSACIRKSRRSFN